MIAAQDGLQISGRTLSATLPADALALRRALAAAASGGSGGTVRVRRPSGLLPYAVLVAPLHQQQELNDGSLAEALVTVADPSDATRTHRDSSSRRWA